MLAKDRLRVSANGRHLERGDGTPFFYLGDTAWELFHRLTREEADLYLADRAAKGFTVIQAVVLAELDGLHDPTPAGHRPLDDDDPLRPNEDYFSHEVDGAVDRAAELGLFIGMLPTWGDKWNRQQGAGPEVFTEANAFAYGRFLCRRYAEKPVIWILGGDRHVETDAQRRILIAMAKGLREGDGGNHLITFHPIGQYSSARYFHDEPWLDFNMVQTGHTRDRDNHTSVAAEYGRTPVKPILDGEPGYEHIGHAFDPNNGLLDAAMVRKFAYWSLFAGACGHTYGCNEVWQMFDHGRSPVIGATMPWREAIHLPGAAQMGHARRLIESGPFFDRIPDLSLVASRNVVGPDWVQACRAPDGRYALAYLPSGLPATLRTHLLGVGPIDVVWFDPRTGERRPGDRVEGGMWSTHTFTPPSAGDWVLVLTRV